MSVNALNTAASALYTNQARLDVSAHNVANVNTDGFQSQEIATTDRAYINDIGTGSRVSAVYAPPRPGPMAVDTTANADTNANNTGQNGTTTGTVEMSNTDLVRETTNQMAAQRAYGVNIASMRVADETTRDLMNMTR